MLVSDSESGIQNMLLNTMPDWCKENVMVVNIYKSNIVHLRPPSVCHAQLKFLCGGAELNLIENIIV